MLALPSTLNVIPAPVVTLPLQDVWRASEMAIYTAATMPSGFSSLDAELPNSGWPRSSLIELLLQQAGIGEMQLLKPALVRLSKKQRIVLVQPPHLPNTMACKTWGIDTSRLLWIKAKGTADAMWTTEQILKNGSCGAVLLWQSNIRNESLRRLNLAAQSTDTWLWLMRPISSCSDASPSQLRIALRPALGGISLDIIKRRGPVLDHALFVPLADMPASRHQLETEHAPLVVRAPTAIAARDLAPLLV